MSRRTPPAAERQLEKAAEQIQAQLKSAVHTTELDALASYYTLADPLVRGLPFCVALARSTFLFHLQMERVAEADVDLYVELIGKVCSHISASRHPFFDIVLREDVFGLSHAGHSVVLLPVQQYNALAHLAAELTIRETIPNAIGIAWRMRLEQYASVRSPLVSLRSQILLVKTSVMNDNAEDLAELQRVIQARPTKMNVDLLLLCYERLQRLVPDPCEGGSHGRALSILSSDIFLKLRSPIRKHYVEHYLYPSLASPDTAHFMDNESTRRHMSCLLLRQCTPGMQPGSPYYMCLCAIIQQDLVEELQGAMELVSLMEYQMPHAAYFISALAVDPHMAQGVFIKMLMILNRGAAHVMAQRDPRSDPVAAVVNNRTTMVYNILFCLRAIARQCVVTDTKRATDLLSELRAAISPATVKALGTFASQAFEGRCDISIEPQLLCAELGIFLHDAGVDDAVDACMEYFKNAAAICLHCGTPKGSTLVCHASGAAHLADRSALGRVLSTVSDCCGGTTVQNKLISLLRSLSTRMLPAAHYLLHHIIMNAGQHRSQLLTNLEPHIRSLLVAVADADAVNTIPSDLRASVLVFHARLVNLFPQDPLQLQSMLKVVSDLSVRCEHDALVLFWLGHRLLRIGRANVELLPIDPVETHYGQDVPGTAPSSYAAADNAQLLLQLLSKVHAYNGAMRKLTGCSVCRLIQDFNVQAPNVVSTLIDSVGLLPNTSASAATFGFPCVPESTFWHFVIRQMKRSAPARTAFVTTATRCVAARFRYESPAAAVTIKYVDPSNHLFAVAFFSALRKSAQMARIVSHMISGWLGMPGHTPGKFVCLLYVCCQVSRVLTSSCADDLSPTPLEDQLFRSATEECHGAIKKALPEARALLQAVPDSPPFQHLLDRVVASACDVVGEAHHSNSSALRGVDVDNAVFDNPYDFTKQPVFAADVYDFAQGEDDALFDHYGDGEVDADDYTTVHTNTEPTFPSSGTVPSSDMTGPSSYAHTLDTIMGTDPSTVSSSSSTMMRAPNGDTASKVIVRDGLTIAGALGDGRPQQVVMPLPSAGGYQRILVRDEASQTSPTAQQEGKGPRGEGGENEDVEEHMRALPSLQGAHRKGGDGSEGSSSSGNYAVPSDVVFDYLMTHQSRLSTLDDLRQLQFADAEAYRRDEMPVGGHAFAYQPYPSDVVLEVSVRPENAYSEPHRPQQTGESVGNVTTRLVPLGLHPHNYSMSTPYVSGHKRQREEGRGDGADELSTPHQPIGSPWATGIDSARNELRSIMSELGISASPRLGVGGAVHVENEQHASALGLSVARDGSRVHVPASSVPTAAASMSVPAVVSSFPFASYPKSLEQHQMLSRSAVPSRSHPDASRRPLSNVGGPSPLPHALVDQHSETALREVRQVMGAANPNTAHTLSGRTRKEPLSANATYAIHHASNTTRGGIYDFV